MQVAVLGSTGFIGQHVARWMVAAGHDVIGIQRGRTPTRLPGVRSLTADRHSPADLADRLAHAAPTVLVDMVAYTAADIEILMAALPGSVRRLVIVSSGDVYWTYDAFRGRIPARPALEPLSERAALREQLFPYRAQAEGPDDLLYWYEKILVERGAQAGARVPVTILRLPMVYGPRDPHQRVGSYIRRLQANPSLVRLNPAEAGWQCTRGYVEDVARAIALAATDERAVGQLFNVGEIEALSELDWVGAIAHAAAWRGQVITEPSEPPSLPANWSVPLVMDTRYVRATLGYEEPVGRAEGLRRTVSADDPDSPPPRAA